MKRLLLAPVLAGFLILSLPAPALTLAPATPDERVQNAVAICHATVLGAECFRGADGGIYTRTWLRVNEAFKGKFPATITVVHRGGKVGEEGEVSSDAPKLKAGEERLFLLGQRVDGTLFVDNGASGAPSLASAGSRKTAISTVTDPNALALLSAARTRYPSASGPDLTAQGANLLVPLAVSGLITTNGIANRFTAGDRGDPIQYLVDADALPAGMTQAQALGAVSNAFRAWANVTSLRFSFAGITSFGANARHVSTNLTDGRIRLQLHDSYNFITGSSTLGVGGNVFSSGGFASGGTGGRIGTNEFFHCVSAYLVMKHTQTTLQNPLSFEEVLCHEIGHILSMDHSSENSAEANTTLKQAMMYFQAHADGRGAALGSYDPPVVQQAYPTNNTPPYGYPRVLDIVTAAAPPAFTGINEVEIRGYDLQTNSLTVSLVSGSTNNGTFTLNGNVLRFTPRAFFSDAPRADPATTFAYERAFVRLSDGTHSSPFIEVRVLSFNEDDFSDGIPNNWMTQFFGNTDPSAGALRGPNDDFDGDGVSNLNEFRLGTNPTNAASVLRFTSISPTNLNWFATPYELYEVEASANFTNWFRMGNPVMPTTTNGSLTNFTASTNRLFFRVLRVP